MNKPSSKQTVDLPIDKLAPHPLQLTLYSPRAEWQVEELAANMDKNGQDEPVEVIVDAVTATQYLVISGMGRLAAAKKLHWKTLRCWVRDDLVAAGVEAVEARLVECNLIRRQLGRLDAVRSYAHLKKIGRNKRGPKLSNDETKGDLRDLIATRFGVSGRTLDRWLQVLGLPIAIQQVVDAGTLPLIQAVKIAGLSAKIQTMIAEKIAKGQPVKAVITEYLGTSPSGPSVRSAMGRLISALKDAQADLTPHLAEIEGNVHGTWHHKLQSGMHFIAKLICQLERSIKAQQKKTPNWEGLAANEEEE